MSAIDAVITYLDAEIKDAETRAKSECLIANREKWLAIGVELAHAKHYAEECRFYETNPEAGV